MSDFLLLSREPELTPEERDIRTVFCMQLSARIRPRDLEEFFSAVGKVMLHLLRFFFFLAFISCVCISEAADVIQLGMVVFLMQSSAS